MSIGVDRLLFVLSQLDLIKTRNNQPILICILDNKYLKQYYDILNYLRENGINSELYLDSSKNLKKQFVNSKKNYIIWKYMKMK